MSTTWPLPDDDLLGALLRRAVSHTGARLLDWRTHSVEHGPVLTTTCWAWLQWPDGGTTRELVGLVIAPDGGPLPEPGTLAVEAGGVHASAWLHPHDPGLPGLSRACRDELVAELLHSRGLLADGDPDHVRLQLVSYRARRRAVVRVDTPGRRHYLKVLAPGESVALVARHALFEHSPVRVPRVLAHTDDHLVVLEALPGTTLAEALGDDGSTGVPCTASELAHLLDDLPQQALRLPPRPAWWQAAGHSAGLVARLVPPLAGRAADLAGRLVAEPEPAAPVVTHGDLHHGQVLVADGRPPALVDLDRLGPGRRADDLGCLLGQLALDPRPGRGRALEAWLPAWQDQVGARALRHAAAGVVLAMAPELAVGPRSLWGQEVTRALVVAERLVAPRATRGGLRATS